MHQTERIIKQKNSILGHSGGYKRAFFYVDKYGRPFVGVHISSMQSDSESCLDFKLTTITFVNLLLTIISDKHQRIKQS